MDGRLGYTVGGQRILPTLDIHGNPYQQQDVAATVSIRDGYFVVITQFYGDIPALMHDVERNLEGDIDNGSELSAPDEDTE